jgi:hypothetical protein
MLKRRITNEIKLLDTSKDKLKYIIIDKQNITIMINKNNKKYEIYINIPDEYPFVYPVIKIKPNVEIIIEKYEKWTVDITLVKIIEKIFNNI